MPTETKMSLLELVQTQTFGQLSPKMGVFVITYLQGYLDTGVFNPVAATLAAYDCVSEQSARTFSFQLMANPKIRLAINQFFGDSPEQATRKTELEIQIAEARKDVRNATDYSRHNARRVLAELLGLLPSNGKSKVHDTPPEDSQTEPTRHKVGDIVVQSGQQFRVAEVDDAGQIVEADEI
jgi:hypothetical protein